jgi:glycosyltransferase involved in cell wall biosynthesis
MARPPRISIITPSLNQAQFLEQSIQSVLSQEYPDLEFFIMDAGSTDGSVDIIRKYDQHLTYWTSKPDGGQAYALNYAIGRATGDIIGWNNSDDYYLPGTLKTISEFFTEYPDMLMVYGDVSVIDGDGKRLYYLRPGRFDLVRLLHECYIKQMAVFFRREMIEILGGFDPRFKYTLDYEMWLRAGKLFPERIQYLPRLLACFRTHEGSGSSVNSVISAMTDNITVRREFLTQEDLPLAVLAASANASLEPLMHILIAASFADLQVRAFEFVRSFLVERNLTAQDWVSLGDFMACPTKYRGNVSHNIARLLALREAWRNVHSIKTVAQRESDELEWLVFLLVRLGKAHAEQGHKVRARQFFGLAGRLSPLRLFLVILRSMSRRGWPKTGAMLTLRWFTSMLWPVSPEAVSKVEQN